MKYDIVVVGASLGGLYAVEELLRGLPVGFPCPVVIVQHRRADAGSRLLDLLRQHSPLAVDEPEDKDAVLPGLVYLAPADYHLLLEPGAFALSVDAAVSHSRPSVDVLFQSAAAAYGAGTVGIVLTGANDDGAQGAESIKAAGGYVIVQDPTTAESPYGPRAALERVQVDAVLHMPQIAGHVVTLCPQS